LKKYSEGHILRATFQTKPGPSSGTADWLRYFLVWMALLIYFSQMAWGIRHPSSIPCLRLVRSGAIKKTNLEVLGSSYLQYNFIHIQAERGFIPRATARVNHSTKWGKISDNDHKISQK
jgi:hypothetical protein